MQNLKTVALQSNLHWEDKEKNYQLFDHQISQINHNCDLIVLPEMFNTGFAVQAIELAEVTEGQTWTWMKDKASEVQSAILGSFIVNEKGNIYNRMVWMNPTGEYYTYDKRHLFRMGGENKIFSSGEINLLIDYKGWKIKPLICYDLRFPVWAKNNYKNDTFDFDILIYIANWPKSRRKAWDTLLSARAIENLSYVIGVNRVGVDGKDLEYSGGTSIYHPKGHPIASAPDFEESVVHANLSIEELKDFREGFNVGLDWDNFEIHNSSINNC